MSESGRYITVGVITTEAGPAVTVGADRRTVTVNALRFTAAEAEEFAQLFVRACWEAARQDGAA